MVIERVGIRRGPPRSVRVDPVRPEVFNNLICRRRQMYLRLATWHIR
jgi:hypothetical protein